MGEGDRQALINTARSLGLNFIKLRERLLHAAKLMNDKQASFKKNGGTVKTETSNADSGNIPPIAVFDIDSSMLNMNLERARAELLRWSRNSLSKTLIEKLNCKDTASVLAAFLLSYEKIHINRFVRLKAKLQDVFAKYHIDGSLFVHEDKRLREHLILCSMSAIFALVHDPAARNPSIKLKEFLREASESKTEFNKQRQLMVAFILLLGYLSTWSVATLLYYYSSVHFEPNYGYI